MKGRYVTHINGAYDTGGAREIQFGQYNRPAPDMASSKPPRVVVTQRKQHTLERSMFGGAYYDVCGRELWYLGKFASERAAIVAWETHLRQRGVIK